MSRDTLQNTKAELHSLLCTGGINPVAELTEVGVQAVYNHEPKPGDAVRPICVTVSTTGMEPSEWLFAVRIYATTEVSAEVAADAIDGAMVACDNLLALHFGPSRWEGPEWIPELAAFVATNGIRCPRADL